MAIYLNKDSKIIVQGITGGMGSKHTTLMLQAGSNIVGGVNARKAGTTVELNGQELGATKDPNGLALFQAFVDTVRAQGKGFVAYQWPRLGSDKPVDKLSYVQGFEPWGWIIGSGVYVDDVTQATVHRVWVSGGIVLASLLGAAYLFLSFYRVMDGGLKETRRHLRAMTDGAPRLRSHPKG